MNEVNTMRLILFSFLLFLFISKILADEGIYTHAKDHILQLTRTGRNSDPVLSPNKRWLAFVRKSDYILNADCLYFMSRGDHGDEIWLYDLKTMRKRLLVSDHLDCNDMSKVILDPNHLKFSPDNKTLYFETSAWVVSSAIHAIDVDGKNLRFVTDGNEYRVLMEGKYRGDLVINQHRYHDFSGGGSYDWDWLFTPSGKQIKLYKKNIDNNK